MNKENLKLAQKHLDILTFRDLSESTIKNYSSYLNQFLNWAETEFPDTPVSEISWDGYRAYVKYLQSVRKLNNRSINCHIAQLHDFRLYVLKREWDRYELPFLHFDTKLPAVPTKEQVNQIIDSAANLKHRAELALLYSSGIRIGELCALRCGDIHMSSGNILIRKAKNRSQRYAVLSQKALLILTEYIRKEYRSATKESWLFPGQNPERMINPQSVRNVFNASVKSCGFGGQGFKLHSLRHAFGLHLYNAGVDLITIKEAMGHKSLSSTEVYLTLGIGNGRSVKSPYDD